MSWFSKHINWIIFLAGMCALVPGVALIVEDGVTDYGNHPENGILFFDYALKSFLYDLWQIAIVVSFVTGIWYLKQKRRSYFFAFLTLALPIGPFLLLALENKTVQPAEQADAATKAQHIDRLPDADKPRLSQRALHAAMEWLPVFLLSAFLVSIVSTILTSAITGYGDELYVTDADGSHPIRTRVRGVSPAWSPDGATITFFWEPGTAGKIIGVMNADGTGARTLTTQNVSGDILPERLQSLGLSPDGKKQIILIKSKPLVGGDIYVRQVDGSGQTFIRSAAGFRYSKAPWFPDSQRIAFGQINSGIFIINADGTGLIKLVEDEGLPLVSPDGTKIAFLEKRLWSDETGVISVMDSDGGNRVQFRSYPNAGEPAWSPDSKKLVFTVKRKH